MGSLLCKAFPASSPAGGWSALPPELADLVLRRLSSLADRVRFASVCRHWFRAATRYSAPTLPRPLPWLNFHDGSFRSLPDGEPHSFRFRRHAVCAGSFGRWLLFEEAAGCEPSRRHFLRHPLLGTTKRLPGRCNEPVDLLNPDYGSSHAGCRSSSTKFFISKVIVCSGDLIAAKVNYRRRRPCTVVCCRPGVSPSWSTGMCNGHWYHDMAFYKGKLYTVTEEGHLFVHEVIDNGGDGDPRVSLIEQAIQAPPPSKYALLDGPYATLDRVRTCYLVISCDNKLLMVRLMLRWTVPFDQHGPGDRRTKRMAMKVFEADLETSRWVELKSLGDQVLFVSSCSSKAVRASSHAHCRYLRGNTIYFIDDGLMSSCQLCPISMPRTCGVYDMSSDTVSSISLGGERINDQLKASWFFP
ncbi:unnamed protein product [Urochloa decumbens]|uniref:DUF295 domain-containing protein n=1 Tax=Urochloa decumbens TaxID=240449 RepID=A0ABC8YIF7_9POAL